MSVLLWNGGRTVIAYTPSTGAWSTVTVPVALHSVVGQVQMFGGRARDAERLDNGRPVQAEGRRAAGNDRDRDAGQGGDRQRAWVGCLGLLGCVQGRIVGQRGGRKSPFEGADVGDGGERWSHRFDGDDGGDKVGASVGMGRDGYRACATRCCDEGTSLVPLPETATGWTR